MSDKQIPIKFKRIETRKPRWDSHPEKTLTQNWKWRQGLFIIFEDYDGNEFDWMPKDIEISEINQARVDVERLNQVLAIKNFVKGVGTNERSAIGTERRRIIAKWNQKKNGESD